MDKRTILAFILCFLVLFGFQYWQIRRAPKPPVPPPPAAERAPEAGSLPTATATATPPAPPVEPVRPTPTARPRAPLFPEVPASGAPVLERVLANDLVEARFTTEGARLLSYTLKDYRGDDTRSRLDLLDPSPTTGDALELLLPGLADLSRSTWFFEEQTDGLAFRTTLPGGITVEKVISLPPDRYSLDVTLRFTTRGEPATIAYELIADKGITPEDDGRLYTPPGHAVSGTVFGVAGVEAEGQVHLKSETAASVPEAGGEKKLEYAGNTTFGGAASKYFAVVLIPGARVPAPTLFLEQIKIDIGYGRPAEPNILAGYRVEKVRLLPDQPVEHRFTLFGGAKVDDVLAAYGKAGLTKLVDFSSWVPGSEPLSTVFLVILRKLHAVAGSYGIAIIILTLLVRAVLHPLSRASMKNMYKMQKLAPKVREIQERYKGKKSKEAAQKMNLEIMELYRTQGASPLLGCLPTLFQLPVFIGLYNALAYSIELRQTRFLYISDLSRPDRLFAFGGTNIPFFGGYFNLLPVLMVITMVVQQKLQPTPPDPQQQQQAKMMQYMMVLFGVLFYHVPSGLVLYFLTSSLLGMAEQRYVKHLIQKGDRAAAA